MSSIVTLASIREAVEAKHGSTVIEIDEKTSVELVNILRLGKRARAEVKEVQADEDVDVHDRLSRLVTLVAKTPAQAKALLTAVGDDTATLVEIVNTYTASTQAGEASPSES